MNTAQKMIQRERRVKFFVLFLGMFAALFILIKIPNLMLSFLGAIVFSNLLAPSVHFFESRGLSRLWATSLPFIVLSCFLLLAMDTFVPMLIEQVQNLQGRLPEYLEGNLKFLTALESKANSVLAGLTNIQIREQLEPQMLAMGQELFENLPSLLSRSLTVMLLTPFFTYFMLLEGGGFLKWVISHVPNNAFELALNLQSQIGQQIGGYIRAKLIQSLLVGLVIWVGLMVIDFPYALVLGLFAALMNIIPYVGPFIGAIPAVIIYYTAGDISLWSLFFVYGLAQVLDNVLIVPFIVAKMVNLHPVTVVVVVIVGAHFWGVLGMLISMPLYSAFRVSLSAVYRHLTDFRV